MLSNRFPVLFHCIGILLLSIFSVSNGDESDPFLKYPFPADFDVRMVRYEWGGMPGAGINIINRDVKSFDSLTLKLYFRSSEELENDLAVRLDVCILYREDGFQDLIEGDLRTAIWENLYNSKPVRMEDTYHPEDQTYAYYLVLPLWGVGMSSQSRIRVDVLFDTWESELGVDHLDSPPQHQISDNDWSFGPHRIADGDLIEYAGVNVTSGNTIDEDFWDQPVNHYVTVHRLDELLWGIPPDWETYYEKDAFIPVDTRQKQDPMPYAPIAVPFDEYDLQRKRDSANICISRIRVNQAGYRPGDRNYFYYVGDAERPFSVVIADEGNTVYTGTVRSTGYTCSGQMEITGCKGAHLVAGGEIDYVLTGETVSGAIYEGIIPDLPQGNLKYRVVIDTMSSAPFIIRKNVYNMVKHALLKFYGVNRCGDSQSWFHGTCHTKDAVQGGWHDCGDHLKEGATMSYTSAVLGLAAAAFSDVDQDVYAADQSKTLQTDGIPDILYEAKHGADFVLRSYDRADGQVGEMVTSIGGFGNEGCGNDHMWWGRPEDQDMLPEERGGPPRCVRSEPTSDYLGKYAANLAFVSKQYRPYDAAYADRCLEAAKAIYDFTKDRRDLTNSSAYSGSTTVNDDMAFGCLALLWATGERQYLDELCFDTTIGTAAGTGYEELFDGGWFTCSDPLFYHAMANTAWSSVHTHVLWGFYRLVLDDEQLCTDLGLTGNERLSLIEKTIYNLRANLAAVGLGQEQIELPDSDIWVSSMVKYQLPWFTMHTQMEWMWNKYQAGNITDLFYYYDVASDITGTELPHTSSSTDWKVSEIKDLLLRSMHYLFGINPWDICMVSGIGTKNLTHPHHRAANPELNTSMIDYRYRHLVGALAGGYSPTATVYNEHANDYMHSEVGIESTTNLLMPVIGLNTSDVSVRNRSCRTGIRQKNTRVRLVTGLKNGTVNVSAYKPIREVSVFMLSGRRVLHVCPGLRKNVILKLSDDHHTASTGIYVVNGILSDGERFSGKVTAALLNR